jgi:hypothetical protein
MIKHGPTCEGRVHRQLTFEGTETLICSRCGPIWSSNNNPIPKGARFFIRTKDGTEIQVCPKEFAKDLTGEKI